MLSRKVLLPISVVGLAACLSLPATALGQTVVDQPVWFTFSNEVALPGATLPAGQYEFKLASSKGDRNIIEVTDKATGKRVVTALAVPTALTDAEAPPEKPAVRFFEVPAGQPPAVRSWWYPGIRGGHEFLYPREQAQTLAKLNKEGVMTTEGEVETGKVTRMTAAEASAPPEPQPQAQAAPEPAQAPAPSPAAQPAPMPDMPMPEGEQPPASMDGQAARSELPQTASEWPLVAAAGMVAVFAGLALMLRRRSA